MIVSLPSLLCATDDLVVLLSPLDGGDWLVAVGCFIIMVEVFVVVEIGGRTAFRSISYGWPKERDF